MNLGDQMTDNQKKAEAFLQKYKKTLDQVQKNEECIADLRAKAESIGSARLDGMPKQHSDKAEAPFVKYISQAVDLEKETELLKCSLIDDHCNIVLMLMNVSNINGRIILQKRYSECKDWATIQSETGYSKKQLFRFRDQALEEVGLMLPA